MRATENERCLVGRGAAGVGGAEAREASLLLRGGELHAEPRTRAISDAADSPRKIMAPQVQLQAVTRGSAAPCLPEQ